MSEATDVVFLGINDAGMRVYEWLCERDDTFVQAMLTSEEQLSTVEELQPDYVLSCGFRHIVPEAILEIPNEGCLNLHPSYLPYNRGANPNVWSIVEGTPAGVTLHFMDTGIDTGDIVARRKVPVDFSDSGKDLYERLEDAQVRLFKETWPEILTDSYTITEQGEDDGTYHRTSDFEDLCELDPDETVEVKEFLDRLRALTFPPYDNARIELDGETYYVEVDVTRE
ncbi:formyltransferase family protein [Natrialba sp. INN-245]|uniref:methionyl-tRNA formyltransferase n=1 Tax=Natrialba sp. INN-245 TaxID=2690967 RepID=UPI001311015E|nr:formyltransferase family protein [Natrialba sp. INN-245]MWV40052.1 formyl transferase [Natrialba sp. INN-245]